jgi:integrase
VVDPCGKNYPTLKKLKGLFSQFDDYAMKKDICNKDDSEYVDILRHKDKNPDKRDHNKFEKVEIDRLWTLADDPYYQIVSMPIYNGYRISELLELKKENVHLDEQYFDVVSSKTDNGIRKVLSKIRCYRSTRCGSIVQPVSISSTPRNRSTSITGTTTAATGHR